MSKKNERNNQTQNQINDFENKKAQNQSRNESGEITDCHKKKQSQSSQENQF